MAVVRTATVDDLDVIYEIWTCRPGASPASAEIAERYKAEFRMQITNVKPPFGIWVAESEGAVIGWASLMRMRSNPALRGIMAECSMYVARSHWGAGASDTLWEGLKAHASETCLEWIVSFVASSNTPATGLCQRRGLQKMGHVPRTEKAPERPSVDIWLWEVGQRST